MTLIFNWSDTQANWCTVLVNQSAWIRVALDNGNNMIHDISNNYEEQLPKQPVSHLSAFCWTSVSCPLDVCQLSVGHLSANCQLTVGLLLADCWLFPL